MTIPDNLSDRQKTSYIEDSASLNAAILKVYSRHATYATRVNSVGSTIYVGEGKVGSASNAPVWRIKKVVDGGGDYTITWANGSDSFTNSWDDHLTITYS